MIEKIPFNVDAKTARLIGRENVSKIEGALIELIKNAYDADASKCILYFEESTGTLILIDNGIGMSKEIIKKHWMSIGFSDKDVNLVSDDGRIKTGAKGIGRFALDRLGSNCEMLSKSQEKIILWKVNWESFEHGKNITSIFADFESYAKKAEEYIGEIKNECCRTFIIKAMQELNSKKEKRNCTIFKIQSLRDEWNAKFVEKIRDSLSSLIPPSLNNNFEVYMFEENTKLTEAKVKSEFVEQYDYSVEFSVDNAGMCNIHISRNEFDFSSNSAYILKEANFSDEDKKIFSGKKIHQKISVADMKIGVSDSSEYRLGDFSGKIFFYKIVAQEKNEKKYYYKPFEKRRNLKKLGGIKIYRDGFRVRPYGEPETTQFDWLRLSPRHYNSAFVPSSKTGKWTADSSQLIGEINISRLNHELSDQANREGIFEDKNFEIFKSIITFALSRLEEDRQYVMRKLNELWERDDEAAKAEEEIREKFKKYEENKKKKQKASNDDEYVHVKEAKKAIEGKQVQLQDLEDENRLLRSLATTGIAINTYMHEIRNLIHDLKMDAKHASEALRIRDNKEESLQKINEIRNITNYFDSWFQVTIESINSDKRKRKRVDIGALLSGCIDSWKDSIGTDINFEKEIDEKLNLDCFPFEIESILHNLISNSYKSFREKPVEGKTIRIKMYKKDKQVVIEYEDNGFGLVEEYKKKPDLILQQMVTSDTRDGKKIGTGLGLWIVNNIVSDYKGNIDLSKNINSDKGFFINIFLGEKGEIDV
ncbi:MAG: ATP-binding protein [Firmicutes bacterium]|nr:ATP-binding protein [Bacillota bacterium]